MTLKLMIISETVAESIARDGVTFLTFAGLIGLGWWIDSSSMQWFGGIIAMISIIGRAVNLGNKRTFTIAEAREELDKIARTKK